MAKRRVITETVSNKTPANKKFGWCTGWENEIAHEICRNSYTATKESANYNVGDLVKCACECHLDVPTQTTRKRSPKSKTVSN